MKLSPEAYLSDLPPAHQLAVLNALQQLLSAECDSAEFLVMVETVVLGAFAATMTPDGVDGGFHLFTRHLRERMAVPAFRAALVGRAQ